MELNDVVRKIKKLLAIAEDPSASDQEIQLAAYRAEKLMFKYKLDRKDIIEKDNSSKNVEQYCFEEKYTAYLIWTLNHIAKYCQTKAFFIGKLNSKANLGIIGFKDDIILCKEIALPILDYMEDTLLDLKECYIGEVDFRIFKRNWCKGFALGIKTQLDKGFIELKEEEKFEVSIIDLHPVVKEYVEKNVKANTSHFKRDNNEGYELGVAMGSKYNFMNKKGIE
ncbi:DUF2786 domain-containing protein [Faecalibacillus faecis]|uniref:DUF2786 domain-containing protein n=1 Tax=Faecalibacillus faecis TaxID=1982628 RepID=UPI00386AF656